MNIFLGEPRTVGELRELLLPFSDDLPISTQASRYSLVRFTGIFPDYTITIVGSEIPSSDTVGHPPKQ